MRIIGIAVLALGLLLGVISVHFVSNYQAMLASQVPPPPETVRVVAAKNPVHYGDRVNKDFANKNLQWVTWPKEAVPEGAITASADLLGEDGSKTRIVLRPIEPGELVLKSKLAGFGENLRVAAQVSEGMRTVTIPIDAVSGVAGLIAPGDRVDILLTRSIEKDLTTSIILQNVLVIATDQSASSDSARNQVARTATVEVDPTDASKLALAQQVGKLSLSLRGVNEENDLSVQTVRLEDLPAQPERVAPAPAPEPEPVAEVKSVRVRKGAAVSDVPVR